jgi:hypothetical protein
VKVALTFVHPPHEKIGLFDHDWAYHLPLVLIRRNEAIDIRSIDGELDYLAQAVSSQHHTSVSVNGL